MLYLFYQMKGVCSMKKFIIVWSIVVAIAILMGMVELVNHEQDFMVLVDYNGNEWIYEGVEDFDCGDIVAAIMEERGTPTIYDDEIIMIRYAGYMKDWD